MTTKEIIREGEALLASTEVVEPRTVLKLLVNLAKKRPEYDAAKHQESDASDEVFED